MSFNAGEIVATLRANVDGFKADLKKGSDNVKTYSQKMSQGFKSLNDSIKNNQAAIRGAALRIGALGAAGSYAVKQWVDAFIQQERAESRLAQVTKQTTNATKEQTEALIKQASALQQIGVVGDEITIFGQSQLATFALQTESIQALTPAMLDMAVATKGANVQQQDMIDIGNMLGKVMGGQVGALSRVGVTFNEAQANILKTGTEMEKAAALAEILSQNFGGLNESTRNTTEGALQAASNAWGDFKEQLGQAVAPQIINLAHLLQDLSTWLQNLSPQTKSFIAKFVLFGATLLAITSPLLIIVSMIPSMVAGFVAIGAAISFISAPLLALIGFIGLVVLAFQTDFLGIRTFVVDTFNGIIAIIELFKMNAVGAFETVIGTVKLTFSIIKMIIASAFDSVVNKVNSIKITITLAWQGMLDSIYNTTSAVFENIKSIFTGVINWITSQINNLIRAANNITKKLSFGIVKVPEIPRLAEGGIVNKPTLAMIGEGGESEAVIPLSKLGNIGGASINIYNPTIFGEEDAREILELGYNSMNLAT